MMAYKSVQSIKSMKVRARCDSDEQFEFVSYYGHRVAICGLREVPYEVPGQ